jgi:putative transposase
MEIRDATHKAWVLGNNRFKQQIEVQAGRRASPLPNGGDRKSKVFENQRL